MNGSLKLLGVFLWVVCLFHAGVGLALNLNLGLKEWVAGSLYGATVDWSDPQFVYILRPLGAFMIALGVLAAVAARDPLRYQAIAYGFVVLFFLRGLQRIVFMSDIETAFSISGSRSISQMVIMWALAAGLFVLTRSAGSGSRRASGTPA
jgi:hypothetical protein